MDGVFGIAEITEYTFNEGAISTKDEMSKTSGRPGCPFQGLMAERKRIPMVNPWRSGRCRVRRGSSIDPTFALTFNPPTLKDVSNNPS
ncbi:unnamed protein product [Haemonchus placei]|uniref:Uncharacterized protein n=1 Tax=Haemonchus placei TaxID=6290 RepID=A0A0N4WTY2_HAEPC|nr:unnamed protein product [Haemonchus placei]